jgi:hypothetical protein
VTSEEAYATPDACVERLGSSFGGGEPAVVAREPYVAAALEDQEDAISSATAADHNSPPNFSGVCAERYSRERALGVMLIELF